MHSLCRLAEPYLPVPQAVIACLHSKPKLTDPNCACGTAGLPEELNSILHCSTSHLTNCRLVTTRNQFRLLFQLSSVHFSPSPASVHSLSFVHFPQLVEAHKCVLVVVRPRWMALESDYTMCVTTAAEGLHLL